MLAGTDFETRISIKEFKLLQPVLEERIYCLQKASWDANIPIIVLLEGWETVRKNGLIRALTGPLDPRGFVFHAPRSPNRREQARPWMWRFWQMIPECGQWAIFDQSWYRRVLFEDSRDKIREQEVRRALRDINAFERMLSDDGTLILKFFLHTDKDTYKRKADQNSGRTDGQAPADSKNLSRRYDSLLDTYEKVLRHTFQDWAPWKIIPADDKPTLRYQFLTAIIGAIQQHLGVECEPQQMAKRPARQPGAKKKTSRSKRHKAVLEPLSAPETAENAPAESRSDAQATSLPESEAQSLEPDVIEAKLSEPDPAITEETGDVQVGAAGPQSTDGDQP